MNFLSRIENFIKTEIIGVDEKKETPISDKSEQKEALLKFETKPNEDTISIESENITEKDTNSNNMSYSSMTKTLENIPTKNFNIRKMIREGAFDEVAGILKEEFNKLPAKEQLLIVEAYKYSVLKFDKLMEEGQISIEVNPEKLISTFGKILYEALKSGDFTSTKDFEENAGNIMEDLGQDFQTKDSKEKQEILKQERIKEDKRLQRELKVIEKFPKILQDSARARAMRRHEKREKARLIDLMAQENSETAVDAIILLDSKNIKNGAKTVLETRSNNKIRTKTADYVNYEKTKYMVQSYKELDDEINQEDLTDYTSTFMANKSEEGVYKFQESYQKDRTMYEALSYKKSNGETLTEEEENFLASMSNKDYTATSIGIGEGALNNVNMTTESKAKFYIKWDSDAKKFSDYKEVSTNVSQILESNSDLQSIREEIKKLQTKTHTNKTSKEKDRKNEDDIQNEEQKKVIINHTNTNRLEINEKYKKQQVRLHNIPNELTNKKQTKNINSDINDKQIKNKVNQKVISEDIKQTGNVKEAINKYGHSAITVILDDTNLKHLRNQLTPILKSYNFEELKQITNKCSDNSFIYICHIVNDDLINELIKNREHTKSISFSAKEIVEKIERQD